MVNDAFLGKYFLTLSIVPFATPDKIANVTTTPPTKASANRPSFNNQNENKYRDTIMSVTTTTLAFVDS